MRKALKVFGIVMDRRRGGKGVPMMPVNAAAFHRGRSGRAVAVAATVSGHNAAMFDTPAGLLTVAISSRALFDLEESNTLFEAQGIDAYAEHQRSREDDVLEPRSEEHTSELQSLMRISYAVFCLKKKNSINTHAS